MGLTMDLVNMEKPIFIEVDPSGIIEELKSDYENMSGRQLYPGQVEMLLINAFAYRETLLRTQIQNAALQNLVAFSTAPYLDFLGDLVGVKRLLPSKATVPVMMSFTDGHGYLTIPAGIRIQSVNGNSIFTLDEDVSVSPSTTSVIANFTAIADGELSNGCAIGSVSMILDPQPYLSAVSNTEISIGGADAETDEALRNRIMLAPQSYSNAGSYGAYDFFARSANAGIADVGIMSPIPGQVHIYPLMQDGGIPNSSVLDEVYNVCNSEKIRPLTDTVIVDAPVVVNYNIEVNLTILAGEVNNEVISLVTKRLEDYAVARQNKLGRDVVIDKIVGECMAVSSVYDVSVIWPDANIIVSKNQVAKYGTITVNVTGHSDE